VIKFLNFIFYLSILFLIISSLFPGSLLGLLLYGDFSQQPGSFKNAYITINNHFVYYFYVSFLGLSINQIQTKFNKIFYKLFFLSIVLELVHFILPNRAFELTDLIANILGVLFAYSLVKIYLHFKKQ
tara:strand:+ start:181 stop:564 length:384 start_codon:yes stop_codon:yes gene_type:complete